MQDITQGFQIENPKVFVPWSTNPSDLKALFRHSFFKRTLKKVTKTYYVAECVSLGGLRHSLGFHFADHQDKGVLGELEFFILDGTDWKSQFREFQSHLEMTFGEPTAARAGFDSDRPHFVWEFQGIEISHDVIDRFGVEEHVRIRRLFHSNQ